MKKACFGLLIILITGLAACQPGDGEFPPLPTLAVEAVPDSPALTEAPEVSDIPEATGIPEVTDTPKKTVAPVITETPQPTELPKSTATLQPTATREPTVTPVPQAVPEQVSEEIGKLLERAEVHRNVVMQGTVCESKEQTNEYVREMALEYSSFGILVEDAGYLSSAKEYMALYPEIEEMVIEKIDVYRNCICATVSGVTIPFDANLCYGIRTGDVSVLTETEKEIYAYLSDVTKETRVRELRRVEAVKALHDYLVLELKYDESFQFLSHSPEGVVKNQIAVCDGYARTMRLLLLMAGIESKIVGGTAGNESHAWNLVKLEDGWYHVDVTWDDPAPDVDGRVRYTYFLKNDEEMAKTHTWESEISCTGNKYQEYVYADVICDSFDTLRTVYENQLQTKKYLTFCYPKNGELSEAIILEFVKDSLQMGLTYYPEREQADYMVLEIVNPLMEQ